jgi:hypothetical protein
MSASYSALTVVGVLFKDLKPQKFTKRSTVTRYNSVTGEPFEKEIITHFIRLGNKEFEFKEFSDLVQYFAALRNSLFCYPFTISSYSLSYISEIQDHSFEDCVVLGYSINEDSAHEYNNGISLIDEDNVSNLKTVAKEWFKNFLLCEVDVKLYTVLTCSY